MMTDNNLLQRFASLVESDRRTAAQMLVDLAEIDRRQLWASEGYSSMFACASWSSRPSRTRRRGSRACLRLSRRLVLSSLRKTNPKIRTSPAPAPSKIEPLSPGRYKVQVTVGAETHDKLKRLQSLLSHATTDPAEIIDRALDELLEATLRKRAAKASAPREPQPRRENTRVIPAAVKREVWKRDDASCAFVSSDGHRCSETRLLQLHHVRPFARGGEATPDNLELRCAAHNQYEANQDFGQLFMHTKRSQHSARNAQTSHAQQ